MRNIDSTRNQHHSTSRLIVIIFPYSLFVISIQSRNTVASVAISVSVFTSCVFVDTSKSCCYQLLLKILIGYLRVNFQFVAVSHFHLLPSGIPSYTTCPTHPIYTLVIPVVFSEEHTLHSLSPWPRGLRHKMFWPAETLGS
jgi:hypothetical protein